MTRGSESAAEVSVVAPRYGVGSLTDVLPSALAALGVTGWDAPIALPRASSYVVLLVDGMGWELLRRHRMDAPFLNALADDSEPITCGVPSTTASSLTSLGTALPPGGHGVVGFTSWIPGTNRLLDAIRWDAKVDPLTWQPHATVFDRAGRQGVATFVVSRRMFERSGLTQAGQRGAAYVGADYAGERIASTVACASVPGSLTYVYSGELDATGHRHGCESPEWRYQLQTVDAFCAALSVGLPDGVGLLVTADHGMVDIALDERVDVDEHPALQQGVRLLGGEARFRHLYCRDGEADAVLARWCDELGDDVLVHRRDDAIDLGWFGAVNDVARERIGDVLAASIARTAVVSTLRFPHEARLVGLHGSLTADEMLVPLLSARRLPGC